jgi:hypothetical protein
MYPAWEDTYHGSGKEGAEEKDEVGHNWDEHGHTLSQRKERLRSRECDAEGWQQESQ